MSEPLGKIFFFQNTLFSENVPVQNKNLKFLSLVFWKINLSKLILSFSNFPCYTKTYKTIDRFFQILDSKKENRCHFFIIFKMPLKELKTFNLSYHFLLTKCAPLKQNLSLEIQNIKTRVFWPIIETMKFINYNNRQWTNPGLLSFRHSEVF